MEKLEERKKTEGGRVGNKMTAKEKGRVDGWKINSSIEKVWKNFDFKDNCLSFTQGFRGDNYVVSTACISNIPIGAVKSSIMMQLIVEIPEM